MMVYLNSYMVLTSTTACQPRTHAQVADTTISTGEYNIFQKEIKNEIEIMKLPT